MLGKTSWPPIRLCPVSAMSAKPAKCLIGLVKCFSLVIGARAKNDLSRNYFRVKSKFEYLIFRRSSLGASDKYANMMSVP